MCVCPGGGYGLKGVGKKRQKRWAVIECRVHYIPAQWFDLKGTTHTIILWCLQPNSSKAR